MLPARSTALSQPSQQRQQQLRAKRCGPMWTNRKLLHLSTLWTQPGVCWAEPQQRRGFNTGGDDPLKQMEQQVPSDQRPSNQLKELKQTSLYSWGTLSRTDYVLRLAGVFAFFFSVVSGPISYQTFDPLQQPLEWFLSSSVGSLVVVAVVVIRVYLGWQYVGERLLSAAVPYEESGWYDGETFVKPPEVLTRDRLLGMYEVKPVLSQLRSTLLGAGALLLACSLLLSAMIHSGTNQDGLYGRMGAVRRSTPEGPIFGSNATSLSQFREDDELAAEEAEAAGGIPGYCRDRQLRAIAGGQYCQQFD